MDNQNKNYTYYNYDSASVDISLSCHNYLLENNFFENSEMDNIELLEQALINYSVLKLSEWDNDFDKNLKIEDWNNLQLLLEALNSYIPTDKSKEAFFAQYTHCIIHLYSVITKSKPIKWTHLNNNIFEMPYAYIMDQGKIKELDTNKSAIPYKIPLSLLNTIKLNHKEKKNPILKKQASEEANYREQKRLEVARAGGGEEGEMTNGPFGVLKIFIP